MVGRRKAADIFLLMSVKLAASWLWHGWRKKQRANKKKKPKPVTFFFLREYDRLGKSVKTRLSFLTIMFFGREVLMT